MDKYKKLKAQMIHEERFFGLKKDDIIGLNDLVVYKAGTCLCSEWVEDQQLEDLMYAGKMCFILKTFIVEDPL